MCTRRVRVWSVRPAIPHQMPGRRAQGRPARFERAYSARGSWPPKSRRRPRHLTAIASHGQAGVLSFREASARRGVQPLRRHGSVTTGGWPCLATPTASCLGAGEVMKRPSAQRADSAREGQPSGHGGLAMSDDPDSPRDHDQTRGALWTPPPPPAARRAGSTAKLARSELIGEPASRWWEDAAAHVAGR